ncbi:MAG: hypothetical protein EOP11_04780 [Proteobacteria bacterium]|nr:MAG: hypothetical protein EOP11_04780 [Pseudomonadota bacterium]
MPLDPAFGSQRGIDPETLLGLVENTAPFLFRDRKPLTPYTQVILDAKAAATPRPTHFDYYHLALSAHYTTVATFVPTDVDNQIRKNLWDQTLPAGVTEAMAALVMKSLAYDFRPVTARYAELDGAYVCGHQGEWFSVAVGAYAAHREKAPAIASEVMAAILKEVKDEALLFRRLKKAKDGVGLLKASTAIAHNLGDLDRVIDQWDLPANDPLREAAYKLGHAPHADFGDTQKELLEAGDLNKAFMASENHRHYPLRKPKCLRLSVDFLLPLGPFFDAWGETVSRHPLLSPEDVAEVAEALIDGFERLSSPRIPLYGYARALGGIQRAFRGGPAKLPQYLPARAGKALAKGLIPEINRLKPEAFEAQWAKKALLFLKV